MAPGPDLTANRILAGLSAAERNRLAGDLEVHETRIREVMYEADEPITRVYFPLTGVLSIVVELEGQSPVEVATVGNEGMVGVPVFLGAASASMRAFAQIPGVVASMSAARFKRIVDSGGRLRELVQRYTQGLLNQVARSAACNARHVIRQRCARWLLMSHDRMETDQFPLTHEFLAQMLGVRRAGVTAAAAELQDEGLITYRRGVVTIKDRRGLERAACDCYRAVQQEYERLI